MPSYVKRITYNVKRISLTMTNFILLTQLYLTKTDNFENKTLL
jgi:hypothetical protein